MSGQYLYCQNTQCGVYLGSLGGDACEVCGWCAGAVDEEVEEDAEEALKATYAANNQQGRQS